MAPIGKSLPVLVAFDVEIGPAHKDTVEANLDPGMDLAIGLKLPTSVPRMVDIPMLSQLF